VPQAPEGLYGYTNFQAAIIEDIQATLDCLSGEGARLPRRQWDEEPTRGSSRALLKVVECEQTGDFYYGARYYDPKISVWLSVDPLAHEYPSLSPYVFVANSPVNAIDPDGRRIVWSIDAIRVGFSMMWTKKGRENWRAMRKDQSVDFKFRVSSSVGVDKRSDGFGV